MTLSQQIATEIFLGFVEGFSARHIPEMVERAGITGAARQSTADAALLHLVILERPEQYRKWKQGGGNGTAH